MRTTIALLAACFVVPSACGGGQATRERHGAEFYESIGFEKRTDIPFGGNYRWIEVYPPAGTTGIALAAGTPAGMRTFNCVTPATNPGAAPA